MVKHTCLVFGCWGEPGQECSTRRSAQGERKVGNMDGMPMTSCSGSRQLKGAPWLHCPSCRPMQAHDGTQPDALRTTQPKLNSKQYTHQGGPNRPLAGIGQNEGGLVGDQMGREALGALWWRGATQQWGRAAPADRLATASDAVGRTGGAGAGGAAGFVGRAGLLGWVGRAGRAWCWLPKVDSAALV